MPAMILGSVLILFTTVINAIGAELFLTAALASSRSP
jgi:hypothetical protein